MREEVDALTDFVPVELCNLDYTPERGAHIEEHCDDSWLWGERLVTLNLLSPVLLTFTLPPFTTTDHPSPHHPHTPPSAGHPSPPHPHHPHTPPSTGHLSHPHHSHPPPTPHIHIPLPPRSLIVVRGPARHSWLHSIQTRNVISRRVGITLRELTDEFKPGGKSEQIGRNILEIAQHFHGKPTNLVT